MDTRCRGIDLSYYQEPSKMRYAEWRKDLCFGWYRASIGKFEDTARVEHGNGLRGAGYLAGMYHVIHESVSAVEQARLFYSLIHEGDELPPALDVERPKVTRSMVGTFVDEWERLGGSQLAMYTSGQSWNKIVGGGERWSKHFLWCAAYPFDTPPQSDGRDVQPMDERSVRLRSTPPVDRNPPLPLPWKKWDVWQFSGHGSMPGYNRFLDLNVYNGTEAELRQRFQKAESKVIHLFIPNNLSDETMRAVTEHLDALAKDVTARGEVYPYGPPNQTKWYELWPSGILNPSRKLRAAVPCTLYSAQNGQPLRTITDGRVMDVYERQGEWFRVTNVTAPIWVKASDVVTL